jgi:hypothetical protein
VHSVNAALKEAHLLGGLALELPAEIVLQPLRQIGDAAAAPVM